MWSKYTQAWGLNRLPHRAVSCDNQRSEVRCSVFWKRVCRHMCRDHAEHKYKIGSHYSMHCAASQPCLTAYCIWRNTSMIQAFYQALQSSASLVFQVYTLDHPLVDLHAFSLGSWPAAVPRLDLGSDSDALIVKQLSALSIISLEGLTARCMAMHFMPAGWAPCFVNWCALTLIPSLHQACSLVQVWEAVFGFIPKKMSRVLRPFCLFNRLTILCILSAPLLYYRQHNARLCAQTLHSEVYCVQQIICSWFERLFESFDS